MIIILVSECCKNVMNQKLINKSENEFGLECRDCIFWALNILIEIITMSTHLDNDEELIKICSQVITRFII